MSEKAPWQKLGYTLKLGLRALPEEEWLPIGDQFGDQFARQKQLEEKARLLDERHDDVFSALPETEAAGAEVLALIRDHLANQGTALSTIEAPSPLHPLDEAARLIPEDLLLLAPQKREYEDAAGGYDWRLVAASSAFLRIGCWQKKMGLPLAGIHEPVPHYKRLRNTDGPVLYQYAN